MTIEQKTLAEWIEEKHTTMAKLAREAGIGDSTLRFISNYKMVPSLHTAFKISQALGVQVEQVAWPTKDQITRYPSQEKQRAAFCARLGSQGGKGE